MAKHVFTGAEMIRYHRRDFLKLGTLTFAGALLPWPAFAAVANRPPTSRSLGFFNTHTAESLRVCYFKDGVYQPKALEKINYVLRDFRTEEIMPIDPHLLDVLYTAQKRLGSSEPFHVISGYRSPETNEMLRQTSSGVASKSMHTVGKAIDIRLPGLRTKKLQKVCMSLKAGGVGYYGKSDFVHVDTGEVRYW
jgi:uncharacterized protein YcbK (DUF882 family)